MLVVDPSVLAPALVDDGAAGASARSWLRGDLTAPDLIDLEVTSVLRRHTARGYLDARRAEQALADLIDLPLIRAPHLPLLNRCWELRDNLTVYDASYVALAEALHAELITADARLARAPGARCPISLVT